MGSDYRDVTLSEVIDVKHGFAYAGEDITDEVQRDILFTPGNFAIGGGFKGDKYKYFKGDTPDEYVLNDGDLVVTMTDLSKQTDTLGFPALVPKLKGHRFLHNQRIGKVVIKNTAAIDKLYLFFLLKTQGYRNEILAGATGTTVKHTAPGRIMSYKTRIPPLSEQKRVAGILGALDDKIELNRKINETLEQMAMALFKSWFVDFDPVHAKAAGRPPAGVDKATADLFPDSFVDSELGQVPKGWRTGKISEEFSLTMGQSPSGESFNQESKGIPFYQGSTDFGFRFPTRRIFSTSPTRHAKEGDTLVSVRAPVGDINMANEDCCIGRGVAAIRHKTGARSFTYYATYNLKTHFSKFEAEGTVFGSINREGFENLPLTIPPEEVVAAFERIAKPIDEKILLLTKQSKNLSSLRDSLLPKMLSGEINTVA